ncbi:MAG TPA: NAD(P)-dependent oxidoreductase [Gaiellaceae bacterium]|jgi:nucleoside-diphosphate-sugar epimerase|nr:NAD(P)-dependent oxidoreductase [Gaiellaceae bacterium]
MKVFVAGASGVIGRRLLPMLRDRGHEVVGMTRTPEKAPLLESLGAQAVVCDVYDARGLTKAVTSARPDAVVHELTDLPQAFEPRRLEEQLAGNDRIRTEGTHNIVEGTRAAGTRRLVAQSIAFAYVPNGGRPRREEDPLDLEAAWPWRRTVEAVAELERLVTRTDGIDGVVLRYGYLYGPGTAYAAEGSYASLVRRRGFPIAGRGTGIFSFVHVDDAATATVDALERGRTGIYNIVDDEPAPLAAWLPVYAEALGAQPPRRVPLLLVRLTGGRRAAGMFSRGAGASNEKAKRELGWEPRYASWRDGFRAELGR